jgi:hypothetical protein
MVTVIWNPHGFHVADLLPDDAKFNLTDFLENIVTSFQSRMFPGGRKKQEENQHLV